MSKNSIPKQVIRFVVKVPYDCFGFVRLDDGPCYSEESEQFIHDGFENLRDATVNNTDTHAFSEVSLEPRTALEKHSPRIFRARPLCRGVATIVLNGPPVCGALVFNALLRSAGAPLLCPPICREPEEASATSELLLIFFTLMAAILACLVLAKRRQTELQGDLPARLE